MVPLLASISCLILCCLLCRGPMCSISTIDRTDIETLPLCLPACLPRLPQGVGSGTPLHGPTKRNETKRPSKRPPMQHHHAGRDTANRPAGPRSLTRSLTRSDIASLRGGTPVAASAASQASLPPIPSPSILLSALIRRRQWVRHALVTAPRSDTHTHTHTHHHHNHLFSHSGRWL